MKRTSWAIQAPGWASPPFFLFQDAYTYQHDARKRIGEAWKKDGETHQQGWRRAYRNGFRIVPCAVVKV